jgi:hypothetical protein
MIKTSIAVIGISALSVLVVLAFFPGIYSSGLNGTGLQTSTQCGAAWTPPQGTYSPSTPVSFMFASTCAGTVTWTVTSQPSGSFMASGMFVCPTSGCALAAHVIGTLPPGSYQFTGFFNGAEHVSVFAVSQFVVTPEFPAGVILATLAPIAAVLGYVKFRKPAIPKMKA